ncbi:hypothetical protein O3M35_005126 [Rhynocoris fuscipes]|uniref:WD repeat-containing protein 76 n=1 Tax=Rhynocoris fuscipes TaxID=488301 RepID=A0AAW1DJS5_9HEMI
MADDDEGESNMNNEEVSEYELLRRKNIEERNKFLQSLGINDAVSDLISNAAPNKPKKRILGKSPFEDLPRREPSKRIRGLAIKKNKPEKELPVPKFVVEVDDRLKGTIKLKIEDDTHDFFGHLVGSERDFSFDPNLDISTCNLESFKKNLSCLQMKDLRKLIFRRIQSICIHPIMTKQIVIVGGAAGPVAIWDINSEIDHDVVVLNFHNAAVNCLTVSKSNHQKIYTTSHEGSICCMDISEKKCTNIFSTKFTDRIKHLTWHDEMDANTLLVAHGNGNVGILDLRTNNHKNMPWIECFDRSCRTVQLHPTNSHYFLASSGTVGCRIFDLRSSSNCISDIKHPKGLTSAFFSPNANHILTTCNDNFLRIFDSSKFQEELPTCKKIIPHNNFTGRWLSVFKAKWFPYRNDVFHIGSLLQPRRIQIYEEEKGTLLYEMRHENMVTISPVIDVHPNMLFIAGGNSSGYVHAFVPPDSSAESDVS